MKKKSPSFKHNQVNLFSYESNIFTKFYYKIFYMSCSKVFQKAIYYQIGQGITLIHEPRKPSQITYLPIIDASPTEYATLYTFMQKCLRMLDKLKIIYLAIVCDQAIYTKVQHIRWKDKIFTQILNRNRLVVSFLFQIMVNLCQCAQSRQSKILSSLCL